MRNIALLISLTLVAGCSKHNPLSCCTSDTQCSMFGLDQVTPCSTSSEVCNADGVCVAPECSTSADCPTAGAPVCVGQLCVAACTGDTDCGGAPTGPYCASDGACVACTQDSECTGADAPVCDTTTNVCRGCSMDSECGTGVCIEAQGTCVADMDVIYLSASGVDTGQCPANAPCASFGYALPLVTSTRTVIRITSPSFTVSSTALLNKSVVVDGIGTTILYTGSSGPVITMAALATSLTLEGMTISSSTSGPAISVGTGVAVDFYDDTITGGVTLTNATVTAKSVVFEGFEGSALACTNGALDVESCSFENNRITSSSCTLSVRRTKFDESNDGSINASGGLITVENNLLIESNAIADLASILNAAAGSTIRFNTFVNTSGMASDGTALYCDANADVTSNIFAYGSQHPHALEPPCPTKYSLYDTVALPQYTGGTSDKVADSSTFFENLSGRDFHPATNSPALSSAEPGLGVSEDYEGNPRPNPVGSTPDMGTYEAP